jgi:hypothetical protein
MQAQFSSGQFKREKLDRSNPDINYPLGYIDTRACPSRIDP